MSEFKVGDKVRYKESEKKNASANNHDPSEVYTVASIDDGDIVYFLEDYEGCFIHRLELADPREETFDYKQALKILAENPEIEVQYQTARNTSHWGNTVEGDCLFLDKEATFRIKPVAKPTFHWLIKSKGKFAVTSGKYSCEEDVKVGYSHPVAVIQKLED